MNCLAIFYIKQSCAHEKNKKKRDFTNLIRETKEKVLCALSLKLTRVLSIWFEWNWLTKCVYGFLLKFQPSCGETWGNLCIWKLNAISLLSHKKLMTPRESISLLLHIIIHIDFPHRTWMFKQIIIYWQIFNNVANYWNKY